MILVVMMAMFMMIKVLVMRMRNVLKTDLTVIIVSSQAKSEILVVFSK